MSIQRMKAKIKGIDLPVDEEVTVLSSFEMKCHLLNRICSTHCFKDGLWPINALFFCLKLTRIWFDFITYWSYFCYFGIQCSHICFNCILSILNFDRQRNQPFMILLTSLMINWLQIKCQLKNDKGCWRMQGRVDLGHRQCRERGSKK